MQRAAHLHQLASQHLSQSTKPIAVKLWVPSTQLNCFQLKPLVAPKKKWSEIIPWQIEDLLLENPEHYQIVWHQDDSDQSLNVFTIPIGELDQWQLIAQANNCDVVIMVPDCFALPVHGGGWTAYVDGEEVIVRSDIYNGFACEKGLFWQLLERELSADDDFSLCLWLATSADLPVKIQSDQRIEIQQRTLHWEALDPPKQYNLLKGSTQNQKRFTGITAWRWTASLASILMLVTMIWLWTSINQFQLASSKLSSEVERDFLQLFGTSLLTAESAKEEGLRQQHQKEIQARLFREGIFSRLRDLDLTLSSCNACEVISLKSDGHDFELKLEGPDNLRSKFANLNSRYDLNWQKNDEDIDVLTLTLKSRGVE